MLTKTHLTLASLVLAPTLAWGATTTVDLGNINTLNPITLSNTAGVGGTVLVPTDGTCTYAQDATGTTTLETDGSSNSSCGVIDSTGTVPTVTVDCTPGEALNYTITYTGGGAGLTMNSVSMFHSSINTTHSMDVKTTPSSSATVVCLAPGAGTAELMTNYEISSSASIGAISLGTLTIVANY